MPLPTAGFRSPLEKQDSNTKASMAFIFFFPKTYSSTQIEEGNGYKHVQRLKISKGFLPVKDLLCVRSCRCNGMQDGHLPLSAAISDYRIQKNQESVF